MDRQTFIIGTTTDVNVMDFRHAYHALHNQVNDIFNDIVWNQDGAVVTESRTHDGPAFLTHILVFGKNIVRKIGKKTAEMLFQFHSRHWHDVFSVTQAGLMRLFDFLFSRDVCYINRL